MTRHSGRLFVRGRAVGVCAAAILTIGPAPHTSAQQTGGSQQSKTKQQAKAAPVVEETSVELLPNPTFARDAEGWSLRTARSDTRAGHGVSGVVRLDGVTPGPGVWSHVGAFVTDPPAERALRFGCWIMGKGAGQRVMVNAFAYDADQKLLANYTAQQNIANGTWTSFSAEYIAPPGTKLLTIWVINQTTGEMFVSDSHLLAGTEKKTVLGRSLGGSGLIRAVEQMAVRVNEPGQTGIVTFPVPGTYRDQVPLSFDVQTTPATALVDYKWRKRADGNNWLCDVRVAPTGKGCIVKYQALVLVGAHVDTRLPKATQPEVTTANKAWTRSTACVQSDDPAIKAKAAELSQPNQDIEAYARQVIKFTSENPGKADVKFDTLDASKALECGGSCTSRANLAAALLRAHGIPARTVAHLPTWSGPLYEHWLVEYWHPGVGWVWLESTLGRFQPDPWTVAVLNIANPEDEDKAFDPLHVRAIMPGAPYQSGIEIDKNLNLADLFKDDAFNSAECVTGFRRDAGDMTALFASARNAFPALAAQNEAGKSAPGRAKRIEDAAMAGIHDLTALLQTEKMAGK